MTINDLKNKMQKDRPMTMISLRIPGDVVEELKRVAPLLGFSGYQPLMRAYIGQGLRTDIERLEGANIALSALVESLRKQGVKNEIIVEAMVEAQSNV